MCGSIACETSGGLNPQARTAKPEADRAKKCALRIVSQLTYNRIDRGDRMAQKALSGENGVSMKIVLIGANGKIGELVQKALAGAGHEIVKVGRKSGDFQVEIENRESIRQLYQAVGSFVQEPADRSCAALGAGRNARYLDKHGQASCRPRALQ